MEQLAVRLEFLCASQNADGGWGYFPGKQSWLEPTAYAALALIGEPSAAERVRRAWELVRSWQNADGGFRPAAKVGVSTWTTALALTFGDTLDPHAPEIEGGTRWLLATAGAESSFANRVLRFFGASAVERDVKYAGWPWRENTSAWVEPTAHSLVALKRLSARKADRAAAARIESAEKMLLTVRCADGGWNYGSPRALGVDLPSYAETTALALVGLQRRAPAGLIDRARQFRPDDVSPLARAWLRLALGGPPSGLPLTHSDVQLCALEALDWKLLRAGSSR